MVRKTVLIVLAYFLLCAPLIPYKFAYCATAAVEYLCELGTAFYRLGRYDDALHEFNKVLMLDPGNQTAKKYTDKIFQRESTLTPPKISAPEVKEKLPDRQITKEPERKLTRENIIDDTLNKLSKKERFEEKFKERPSKPEIAGVKITGETQLSLGMTLQDTIWKQADGDLNEENWRTLSENGYNRRANTYDARVYDRLRVNLGTDNKEGFGFYSNITIDPWSFTGKSDKITIGGVGTTDAAEIELKYWGNSSYTVNETVYTLRDGASMAVPEIKVVDGKVPRTILESTWTSPWPGAYFVLPETEIEYEFQPLRELWFDYKQENLKLRFFPIAYQDQAFTSDDPLKLSNNHIWWEESPWLDCWLPGNYNSSINDFNKGKWDDSLSYRTRDSDGTRLTALRGLSFSFEPEETTSFATTFASPKGLWQDYDSFDNFVSATRIKHLFTDNFSLGGIYTFRLGLNEDKNNKKDITNHVIGLDLGYEITEGLKLSTEAVQSFTKEDLTSSDYASKSRGNAYYFSLIGTLPQKNIMDLKYGYDEIKPEEGEDFFAKMRLYLAHMDEGFDPTLATYRETRDDAFWSRHIHFKKPFEYYYSGLYYPSLKWEDIEPFRIGNGIDIGRDVIGFRLESSLWNRKLDNLFDVRNVHNTNGKFVENVARDEVIYKIDEKLTTKLLGIYQKIPKTKPGVDPFLFDPDTGNYLANSAITDAQDPSLKTGSLGLEYAFFDWLSWNGIWERTNDYNVAYDNFPRGNLNSTTFSTSSEYDRIYRSEDVYLYSQSLFPLPPYPFYNIFKTGLRLNPLENLEIYLDYTRNEFKSAGQIDDNMNHIGFEVSYAPTKKIGFYTRYTYSRWNDLTLMTQGYSKYYLGHHNFFGEFRYFPSKDDEFVMQYGESGRSPIATITFDPFGTALPTLDTQHIFRIYYRRKF